MSDDELKAIVERELNMYDVRWYHRTNEDNGEALDKAWIARGVVWEVARRVAAVATERAAKVAEEVWFSHDQSRHDMGLKIFAAIRGGER